MRSFADSLFVVINQRAQTHCNTLLTRILSKYQLITLAIYMALLLFCRGQHTLGDGQGSFLYLCLALMSLIYNNSLHVFDYCEDITLLQENTEQYRLVRDFNFIILLRSVS